jgi:hypothetical protein
MHARQKGGLSIGNGSLISDLIFELIQILSSSHRENGEGYITDELLSLDWTNLGRAEYHSFPFP